MLLSAGKNVQIGEIILHSVILQIQNTTCWILDASIIQTLPYFTGIYPSKTNNIYNSILYLVSNWFMHPLPVIVQELVDMGHTIAHGWFQKTSISRLFLSQKTINYNQATLCTAGNFYCNLQVLIISISWLWMTDLLIHNHWSMQCLTAQVWPWSRRI